jgi:hypothetical protein
MNRPTDLVGRENLFPIYAFFRIVCSLNMLVERLMSTAAEVCFDVFFDPVSRDVSLLGPGVVGKALNKFLVGLELSSEPMARFFLVRFVA